MYNPSLNDILLRQNMRKAGIHPLTYDDMVARIRALIAAPDQKFPDRFYDIVGIAKQLADMSGCSHEEAVQSIFENPIPLFALNDLETAKAVKPSFDRARALQNLSPLAKLQSKPRRISEGKATFSQETIDILSVPAIDQKTPKELGRRRWVWANRPKSEMTEMPFRMSSRSDEARGSFEETRSSSRRTQRAPHDRLKLNNTTDKKIYSVESSYSRLTPKYERKDKEPAAEEDLKPISVKPYRPTNKLAKPVKEKKPSKDSHWKKNFPDEKTLFFALHNIKTKTNRLPNAASSYTELSKDGPSWSTIIKVWGEQGLTPRMFYKAHMHLLEEQPIPLEKQSTPLEKKPIPEFKASIVFATVARYLWNSKTDNLNEITIGFHNKEEVDRAFRQNKVEGLEEFLSPEEQKSLNRLEDFALATNLLQQVGSRLVSTKKAFRIGMELSM